MFYLVERPDDWGYDDYSAFVCFANSEDEARHISPSEYYIWKENGWHFNYAYGGSKKKEFRGWVQDPSVLKVWELSRFNEPKIILASYHAG